MTSMVLRSQNNSSSTTQNMENELASDQGEIGSDQNNNNANESTGQNSTQPNSTTDSGSVEHVHDSITPAAYPAGIPEGLPQHMWLGYFQLQAQVEADKEVRLREVELGLHARPRQTRESESVSSHRPTEYKFRRLKEQEDVDIYLKAFERYALTNNWPKTEWSKALGKELSGPALDVYTSLSYDEVNDYDTLKNAILAKYEVNAESFRRKFHSRYRKPHETIKEMIQDLTYNFKNWILHSDVHENDGTGISELMIMNQAILRLPNDLAIFLKDKKPKSSKELATLADEYIANRGGTQYWQKHDTYKYKPRTNKNSEYGFSRSRPTQETQARPNPRPETQARTNPRPTPCTTEQLPSDGKESQNKAYTHHRTEHSQDTQQNRSNGKVQCYNCQQYGHYASDCKEPGRHRQNTNRGANPKKACNCEIQNIQEQLSLEDDDAEIRLRKCDIKGTINGHQVTIGRDSQCTQSVVCADIIPSECYTGKNVTVRAVTGTAELPLAKINLQCELVSGEVTVAVVPGLHREMLIGHDLDKSCGDIMAKQVKQVCVITRQQAKQEIDERQRAETELLKFKEELSNETRKEKLIPADTFLNGTEMNALFTDESEKQETRPKAQAKSKQKTRPKAQANSKQSEKKPETGCSTNDKDRPKTRPHETENRQARPKSNPDMNVTNDVTDNEKKVTREPLQKFETSNNDKKKLHNLQSTDETLKGIRDRLVPIQDIDKHRVCFYKQNDIIMRKWQSRKPTCKETTHQVVVPEQYRPNVLEIAHDITMAGHLEVEKTKQRILTQFYWPGIFQDVSNYCKSCATCQKIDKTKVNMRAPLIPLPIIDVPFKRIGMDILGPMTRSRKGKRYLLTICDYATRYPEAVPLSNIRTDTVAEALINVFSRVGIPEEIIHDQGSNFMSETMKSICEKLNITQVISAIHHHQTGGKTERKHRTLNNMLRSLTETEMKSWDEYIPHFLFAYREVPHNATGFSPFELLYGREVRGPLSVLKHNWTSDNNDDNEKDIVTHLMDMRKRIKNLMQEANENQDEYQKKMKKKYDKDARTRQRSFEPGEQVLIFLPEKAGKLDNKWQGPYTVIRKINAVNYLINLSNKRKAYRVIHVNMCKKWYDRDQDTCMAKCYCVIGNIDELTSQYNSAQQSPQYHEEWDQTEIDEADLSDEPLPVKHMDQMIPNGQQTQNWKDISVPDHLDSQQRLDLQNLLEQHKDIFTDVPGRTNVISHTIRTKTDTPVRQKLYRTPHALRDKIRKELDSLLELGIIEPSNSPYASPITVVVKPGGKDIRICSDMRALNKICVFDPYVMPRIDTIIDQVSNARYISTLDLTKGFYQVPLEPSSRPKTSFITEFGQFQFTVLPFGLQNSSSSFMRLVDKVLEGCHTYAQAYIDDIAIFSQTWDEHIRHVNEILTRIANAGLTVKPKKCNFANHEVSYLGHIVGNSTIKPKLDKIESVMNFPRPLSKKQVRAFLGLTGYYRKFVPNFASIARPLTDLTKKRMPNKIEWNDECECAFNALKKCLTSKPILSTPNFSNPFILQTDASNTGLGAVLSQIDDNGDEKPIAFISRKLLEREEKYTISEKECLAIVWAIGKFEYYLYGQKFTVMTDHQALKWLEQNRSTNHRLTRWFLALQPYHFHVMYKKGTANTNADGLSRA